MCEAVEEVKESIDYIKQERCLFTHINMSQICFSAFPVSHLSLYPHVCLSKSVHHMPIDQTHMRASSL